VPQNQTPNAVSVAVKRRLIRLCETYQKELTPEMLRGYIDALADLTELEVEIAFVAAMRRANKFMPNPGEIREALVAAKEKIPAAPSGHAQCSECDGTGFKLVPHPKASEEALWKDAKIAQRCNHEAA
jgi:hypothetical protein